MPLLRWPVGLLWIAFWIYWLVSATTAKRAVRSSALRIGVAVRLGIVVVVIALFRSHAFGRLGTGGLTESPLAEAAGLIVCAVGLGFAVWARIHLGRNWGMPMTRKEEPELVTSGPYTYVRNPIYTGILVALLGTALDDGSWWFVLFVAFGAYFIYAARREEHIMADACPSQYPEYRKRTKMLIPFII